MGHSLKRVILTGILVLQAGPVVAADQTPPTHGVTVSGVISTVVYSVLGMVILMAAYKIFDWVTPYRLQKELAEDQNIAIGTLLCGIFIALAIIIAASIV